MKRRVGGYMDGTLRPGLGLALVAVAIVGLVAAGMAGHHAKRLYLQRAQLLLEPTHERTFAAENARLAPPRGRRVVMFGDSRISKWNPKPQTPGQELIWRGISGETTAQMLHRYGADTRGIAASVVVIEAGINDLAAGVAAGQPSLALERTFANLRAMVESSRGEGIDVVLLTVVPPANPPLWRRAVWSDDIYLLVNQLNDRLRHLRAAGVTIVDAQRLLCGDSDRMPARLARDTMHLREEAYVLLNEGLVPGLREYDVALQ